jgi:GH35 family endo-1,4-beta-xylanase
MDMPNLRTTRLPVTLLLAWALSLLATTPAAAQSAPCAVDYRVQNQWPGGFTANVTITNAGPAIDGWTLQWDFPDGQRIAQVWNAVDVSDGSATSVSNAAWNRTISSGGSVAFGFNGTWSGANGTPASFTLNGTTCGGDPGPDPDPDPGSGTLRDAAAAAGIEFGTAVAAGALANEADYREVLAEQFSSVTAENVMKPDALQPQRGQFTFAQADALVDFAQANGQSVRGHTLVWHNQNPGWLTNGAFSDAEKLEILRDHVTTVVTHFRGRVKYWDVANEVLDDGGNLRASVWSSLGESYIAEAFRAARAADPDAKLYLNDYSIEGINAKSDAYYALVQRLLAQGVPIDGMGFQTHLINGQYPSSMPQNLQRFADLGLDVAITEADVRIPLPVDAAKLATQAETYRSTVNACLAVTRCVAYTVWGLSDRHSWIPDAFDGYGAATLLDEQLAPKPAYDAVLEALQEAG